MHPSLLSPPTRGGYTAVTYRLHRILRPASPYAWRLHGGYIGSLARIPPMCGGYTAVTSDPWPRRPRRRGSWPPLCVAVTRRPHGGYIGSLAPQPEEAWELAKARAEVPKPDAENAAPGEGTEGAEDDTAQVEAEAEVASVLKGGPVRPVLFGRSRVRGST